MDFTEYRLNVDKILNNLNYKTNYNLQTVFECYLNSVTPKTCVKSLLKPINENFFEDKYTEYKKQVLHLMRKQKFDIRKPHPELENLIRDFYADETEPVTTATECIKWVKQHSIKVKKDKEATENAKTIVYNKLLLLFHNIENAALKRVSVKNNDIYAELQIKLFTLRNEINTDIKSYLNELHKQFIPFLNQNVDRKDRIDVIGYSLKNNNVYCNINIKMDCISNDGFKDMNFSKLETVNMFKMYIEIFRTFAEQYSFYT